MLLERGPIEPVDVDAWTLPGPRTTLAADAAVLAATIEVHGDQLGVAQSTMAAATRPELDEAAALDLAAAAAAHQAHAVDADPSIADIASHAGGQDADLAQLMLDTAADIAEGEPAFPDYVDHPVPGIPDRPGTVPDPEQTPPPRDEPPPPGGGLYEYVAELYRSLLDREGSDGEIQGWVDTGLSAQAIRDAFIGSDEYRQKHGG